MQEKAVPPCDAVHLIAFEDLSRHTDFEAKLRMLLFIIFAKACINNSIHHMGAIRISVNKQMDGYGFSIAPSLRQLIKSWFPNAHPANNIFVSYDIKDNFEHSYNTQLERYIYPALLGVDSQSDLKEKVDEIQFIDTQTGKVLHTHQVTA